MPRGKTDITTADIPPLTIRRAEVRLVGITPLIVHAWSDKAKQMIKDKQTKVARTAKGPKDMEQEYQACFYRQRDGTLAIKATALKSAAVDACSSVADITKVAARSMFFIEADPDTLIPLEFAQVGPREDMVRIGMGVADIRIRPQFDDWAVTFTLTYNANIVTLEQIALLFNTAGYGVGVGEWRPQKEGEYGRFEVAYARDLGEVKSASVVETAPSA